MTSIDSGAPQRGGAKSRAVAPADFFKTIDASGDGAGHVVVLAGAAGVPNVNNPQPPGRDWAEFSARTVAGRRPAYFTPFSFADGAVSRYAGRSKANAVRSRVFGLDVEGEQGKAGGGYDGPKAATAALGAFLKAAGLLPGFIVSTGGAGLHAWFVVDRPLTVAEWMPRARALVALAERHGLSIDAQCTTDPARMMRAPGSVHQKTGRVAQAVAYRAAPHSLAEFDTLVGVDVNALAVARFADSSINRLDVLDVMQWPTRSYIEAAKKCGAMRKAAEGRGAGATYPVWLCALATAKASVEGREFAHEISSAHADYDEAATDRKLDSLTGGPASCDAWADAYGKGGPCESCEWRAGR